MLKSLFEAASGTTTGAKHRRGLIEPNQDSVLVHESASLLTLAVSDGCGSTPHSHVGSHQSVRWFTQLTHQYAADGIEFDETTWPKIASEIAERIRLNASWSHLPLNEAVAETWSATLVGMVVGPELTHFVIFGDGSIIINGEIIRFEAEGNAPAYPSYLVAPSTIPSELLKFTVITRPTNEIKHAVIASDGIDDLIQAAGKSIFGTDKTIPTIEYLWKNPEFFGDPQALDRWLNFVGRDWRRAENPVVIAGGRLNDDIAIGAIRRMHIAEE